MKTKLSVLYFFLLMCMLVEASKSEGVHLRPTVCDIPEMKKVLTIDVSGGETWDSICVKAKSLKVIDDKSVEYTLSRLLWVDEDDYVDSSAVYVRWRDGEPDTAKIYFHYPESFEPYFHVEKIVEGEECLREGGELKQTVRVQTTCPTTFLMVGTGIENTGSSSVKWERRSVSFSGVEAVDAGDDVYEVELHAGDVLEYTEDVLLKEIDREYRSAVLFGIIWLGKMSSEILMMDMVYENEIGLCKDQTYRLNSCDEPEESKRLYFYNPYVMVDSYELMTTELPSGATVVMNGRGGYVDYTPHSSVATKQTDYIHYKRKMKDGTEDYGLLTVELLPCITDVTVQKNDNEMCNDDPCDYDGPSILINEVMVSPKTNDGAIYSSSDASGKTERGGEWIELYNPDVCHAVDISGYFFGNATSDSPAPNTTGTLNNLSAGFVLPEGTIVPPCGYCVLRGEYAEKVDEGRKVENGGNVAVINLDEHLDRFCLDERGWRFWLPNQAGWFGFYDRNGVPQDAVRWGTDDESTLSVDGQPCNAGIGEYKGGLSSYSEIQDSRKSYPFTKRVPDAIGKSLARTEDAGEWSEELISPTIGYENATPYHRADERCTGSISLQPHGGIGPFSYQWNDPRKQNTPTATGLCEGTYCCEITDLGTGYSRVQCVTLETYSIDCPDCPEEIPTDTVEVVAKGDAYQYEGRIYRQSGTYCEHYYTARGCDSTVCLKLTLMPEEEEKPSVCSDVKVIFHDTICMTDFYRKNGFEIDLHDEHCGTKVYQYMGETVEGCDSLVVLYLVVEPCSKDKDDDKPEPCDESEDVIPDMYFTPNADGVHDYWEIANIGCFRHEVHIFDRFGKELRSWKNNFDGWDGTYLGKPMPSTDYWYTIRLLPHGKTYTGHFTLVR